MADDNSIYLSQSVVQQNKASIIKRTDNNVLFRACVQEGDLVNRNNKVYPTAQIAEALKNELIQQQIKTGTWYGEANHPLDQRLERQLYLMMNNASHSIRSIEQKGNRFISDILTTGTEVGKFMYDEVTAADAVISFSMRGIHKLIKDGTHWLVQNLRIFTYDWVPVPSHHGAMMCAANEGANFFEQEDDSHVIVKPEEINKVIGAEGVGSLAMMEDLVDGVFEKAVATKNSVTLKSGNSLISFSARKKISQDILSSFF